MTTQAYNFFEEQPIKVCHPSSFSSSVNLSAQSTKNASIYLLRAVLNDLTNSQSLTVLTHLRSAAQANSSTLIIGNHLMPYACEDTSYAAANIPGARKTLAPEPLLANLGRAGVTATYFDLTVSRVCLSSSFLAG